MLHPRFKNKYLSFKKLIAFMLVAFVCDSF